MISLDMRTVMCGFVITNIVNTLVIVQLFVQNRSRYKGTAFWVAAYCLQIVTLLAIALRHKIPDWISIDFSNTVAVISTLLCFIGLERFTGKKGPQIHNYVIVALFAIIHTWYTFFEPNLGARTLNLSLAVSILSFQSTWLVFHRASKEVRKLSREVGLVFALLCLVNLFRAADVIVYGSRPADFFKSGDFDVLMVIFYQTLLILLTYSLILMFNKRLVLGIATQEDKFSKAFHSFPYPNLITRVEDGRIIEANKGFLKMTGYESYEVIEKTTIDIHLWQQAEDRDQIVKELAKSGHITENEHLFSDRYGNTIIGLLSSEIISLGNEQCIISTINDVTARKNEQKALAESEARLRDLNATKDKFFSIIAHDLKNPFNAITGISNLLSEQIRNKEYEALDECVNAIRDSSQRAMNLLTNLLEWSRSQTGRMCFNPDFIDMVVLINEAIDLSNQAARQKSISITKNLPRTLIVVADRAMVSTILRNLISNAVKFTNNGGSVIISSVLEKKVLEVSVSDTGVGIPADVIPKLFRIDESCTTKGTQNETGTGLGLLLCKEFVEKHDGKIWVESDPGKGSKFSFSIPVN